MSIVPSGLIEGFTRHGIAVDIIYGGMPIAGLSLEAESIHYLPPIKSGDNAYSFYLDGEGKRLDNTYLEERTAELLQIFSGS